VEEDDFDLPARVFLDDLLEVLERLELGGLVVQSDTRVDGKLRPESRRGEERDKKNGNTTGSDFHLFLSLRFFKSE